MPTPRQDHCSATQPTATTVDENRPFDYDRHMWSNRDTVGSSTLAGIILLLFVLSGFTGLTYELIWTDMLRLIFGVTSQAISTVLAAFMGGLALGSLIFGRLADRSRSPLRFYAVLEAGIAVSVLVTPYLFSSINRLYVLMAQSFPTSPWVFTTSRFLLSLIVLLIPTTLMGGTLPVISKFFVARLDRVGRGVGWLYAANTIGGIAGCLATGFLLVRFLGTRDTTLLAVAINLLVVLGAVFISTQTTHLEFATSRDEQDSIPTESSHTVDTSVLTTSPSLARFVLLGYGVAGATSLAYEVLWTRILLNFLGIMTYAFTTILATFLCGLALGSLCFARVADRRRDLLVIFGLLEIGVGLCAIYLLHTIDTLAYISPLYSLAGKFAGAFALMLVPTFLMGAVFPVVTRLYTPVVTRLGTSLGNLYGANTIGCVVGALVAGFILLPTIGAQRGVLVVAVINVLLGLGALVLSPARSRLRRWAGYTAVPALLAGILISYQPAPTIVHSRRFRKGFEKELLYYNEGAECSLAVVQYPLGVLELNINGTEVAATDYYEGVIEQMLGHLPMLLAKHRDSALIIGFGTGATSGSIIQHPVQRLDCVELVPDERETAQYFLSRNRGVLNDPRTHFIPADGRNHLLTTQQTYDVIALSPIHPSLSPYLYTREFYELCKSRLRQDGVMCAWIPTNTLLFDGLLRTFQTVFPHATLWFSNLHHTCLIGTPEPLRVDFATWEQRIHEPRVRNSLGEVWLDDPVRLLSTFVFDEETTRRFSAQAPINTDNHPCAKYDRLANPFKVEVYVTQQIMAACTKVLPYVDITAEDARRTQIVDRLDKHFDRMAYAAGGWYAREATETAPEALKLLQRAVADCPEDPRGRYYLARAWLRTLDEQPDQITQPEIRRKIIKVIEAVLPEKSGQACDVPRPPETYLADLRQTLAHLQFMEGRIGEAEHQIRLVLEVDANDLPSRRLLGEITSYYRSAPAPPPTR